MKVDTLSSPTGESTLISLFKRRARSNAQTGLFHTEDGLATAVVCRRDEEGPRLLQCSYTPVNDLQELPGLLQQVPAGPTISVAEPDTFSLLLVETPEINANEIKAAMRWRIKDLLSYHIDDAVIDVFDIPGQKERGRPKQMYVVAAKISTIQSHIDLLESNNIQLEVIDIPELALRNITTLLPESASGVAMLYFGEHEAYLVICREGVLYLTRSIKLGYRQLAQFMVEEPAVDDEFTIDAFQPLPEALTNVLEGVVLEIQRSLDYCESHFALPPVSGLVIAPMPEEIPSLMSFMASNLGVPVRLLDINAVLEGEQVLDDELQCRCLLAIGAALREEDKTL